jgi:TM2 domain-containing membrane protein YozV
MGIVALFLVQSSLMGFLYMRSVRQVIFSGQDHRFTPFVVLIATLCGAMITGVVFFCLGHLGWGLDTAAWIWTALTLILFVWNRVVLKQVVAETSRAMLMAWSKAPAPEKRMALGVLGVSLLRSMSTLAPQTHGDPYLYHLTVGRIWDRMGYPGVDILNVTTGYSWSVESIYAYLYQFTGTGVVHILAAQQLHCFFGFYGLLLAVYKIIRIGVSPLWSMVLLLPFMTPYLTQMAFFAKNDALAFLMVWILVWAVVTGVFGAKKTSQRSLEDSPSQVVFLIAPFLLAAKVTAALGCAVVGGVAILVRTMPWYQVAASGSSEMRRMTSLFLWSVVGVLALIGVVPYLFANELQTGNPLFPILNNLFGSPLMPPTAKAIVHEMSPLASGPWDILRGSWAFFQDQVALWILPFACVLTLSVSNPVARAGRYLFGVGLVSLLVFQVTLNSYDSLIEQRHFKLASYGLLVAAILLASQIAARTLRSLFLGMIVSLGAIHLQLEVNVRDVIRRATEPDLRSHLFREYQIFPLLMEVNSDKSYCDQCAVYVVGRLSNEGYYLDRGHLVHETISAPLVPRERDDLQLSGLELINAKWLITHAVVPDSQPNHPGTVWVREHMDFIKRFGNMSLYRRPH